MWLQVLRKHQISSELSQGFRAFDTANQRKHYHEQGVGDALKRSFGKGLNRAAIFLQTKFTYRPGQDHRLPYDPDAELTVQVAQSMASSLEHLGADHVDSYVLHGPASGYRWTDYDAEVWAAMLAEQRAGRARLLGVSNVSLLHLRQLAATGAPLPAFVQNRCFARRGWDRDVRGFCRDHSIVYQGFSLLTANPEVLAAPLVRRIAARERVTEPQVIF